MKYPLIIILLMTITGCATAPRPWTPGEKTVLGWSVLASALDGYTTIQFLKNPNNYEVNPIMGKHPSNGKVIITLGLSELIAVAISHWYPVIDFPLIGKVNMRYGLLGMKAMVNSACAINNTQLDWD